MVWSLSRPQDSQPASNVNHKPVDKLALLSAMPEVTFPAGEYQIILLCDRGTQV